MLLKDKKIISIIFTVASIILAGVALYIFIYLHTSIGMILAITAAVMAGLTIVFNICIKVKNFKSIILHMFGGVISISVLIFAIIGTVKISSMKNKITSEYISWVGNTDCSYIEQKHAYKKVLDLQNSAEEYEEIIDKSQKAQEEYEAIY